MKKLLVLLFTLLPSLVMAQSFEDVGLVQKVDAGLLSITVNGQSYTLPIEVKANDDSAIRILRVGHLISFSGNNSRIDSVYLHPQSDDDIEDQKNRVLEDLL